MSLEVVYIPCVWSHLESYYYDDSKEGRALVLVHVLCNKLIQFSTH
jgi:hypothetical protein